MSFTRNRFEARHVFRIGGSAASIGLALVIACTEPPPDWVDGALPTEAAHGLFFDPGDLDGDPRRDAFLGRWFSKHLAGAGEPSLRATEAATLYRFTHLPSFRNPVVVRVEERRDGRFLVAKRLSGHGGYDPGELAVERHRRLTRREWAKLEREIAGMRFWALPRHPCEAHSHPEDGMVWLLEGFRDGEYGAVHWHWDVCAACILMIDLAEVELEGVVPSEWPSVTPPPLPPEVDGWL